MRFSDIIKRSKVAFGLFSFILLSACSPKLHLSKSSEKLYPVTADLPRDSAIMAFISPYKSKIDSEMNVVIAVAEKDIEKGRPEGTLNNMFADAMFIVAKQHNIKFDIAYTNYGGLRLPISKGNIRMFTAFELMPFENMFTTVKFKGTDMLEFFHYIARNGGDPISGASFKIKDKTAVDVKINGSPLNVSKEYIVLTSDYMANGGDGGEIFKKAVERKDYTLKLRDALIQYMKQQTDSGKTINPQLDGRITVE